MNCDSLTVHIIYFPQYQHLNQASIFKELRLFHNPHLSSLLYRLSIDRQSLAVTMVLKRKRSESELSTSTTSTFNSPPRINSFSPQSSDVSMDTDDFTFTAHYPVSPLSRFSNQNFHIPGRTMKRLRDNRPSEHEVHRKLTSGELSLVVVIIT